MIEYYDNVKNVGYSMDLLLDNELFSNKLNIY